MKINLSIIALALAATALLATSPAEAGKRHHRSSHGGYYDGYYSGGHYRGHRRHHYNRGYYRHRSHGYRYRDHRGAYLAGGLILGSALTHAFSRPRHYDRTVETVVYRESEPRSSSTVIGRRLLKDRNGDCWERKVDDAGNELLAELPAQECNW